jgi:hypothetical protein
MSDEAFGGRVEEWQRVLWWERHYCNDKDYARHLYYAVTDFALNRANRPISGQQSRPLAHEVEAALRQACQTQWGGRSGWQKRLRRLDQFKTQPVPVEKLVADLQSLQWFKRFMARQSLLYRGSEAVEVLAPLAQDPDSPVSETADWLLHSISAETSARLGRLDDWACPQCLTRCAAHSIPLKWQPDIPFYGCRVCRRSWGLHYCPAGIVAVLDHSWTKKYELEVDVLRVNWLEYRTMFDFDCVEIVQATDEEAERFAVQAGNDTDWLRQPLYPQMRCLLGPECRPSENTLRILKRTFGYIGSLDDGETVV